MFRIKYDLPLMIILISVPSKLGEKIKIIMERIKIIKYRR